MKSTRNVGRIIGVLVLIHMATGLTIPYILLDSLTAPPASFLANAAGISFQVRLSVVLLLVGALRRLLSPSRHGLSFVNVATPWGYGCWLSP
jgi:hypothetical protein